MSFDTVDCIVIGAGVIGLAVARALARSGREVLVLEANPAIGQEISSRSSEVIHAGLYYQPGSLKARCCLRGQEQLYEYCSVKGVPHRRLGKLIVAVDGGQATELERIRANAEACGVEDLEMLGRHRLELLEPAVRAQAALWSPNTGIIDSHALMLALQADLEAAGGSVVCNTRVIGGRPNGSGITLFLEGDTEQGVYARAIVNAGGLHAARLARCFDGLNPESIPRVHFVLGHYFTHGGRHPFQHLVYPLPEAGGLGIHGTLDLAGQLRFGPDTQYIDRIDYAFDEKRREAFAASIRRWYPELDEQKLQPAYTGIRPRLSGPGEGFRDFVISGPAEHGLEGLINLYGIESPGLTGCLALAEEVANLTG